jgi:hypothetical protein
MDSPVRVDRIREYHPSDEEPSVELELRGGRTVCLYPEHAVRGQDGEPLMREGDSVYVWPPVGDPVVIFSEDRRVIYLNPAGLPETIGGQLFDLLGKME